MVANSMIKSTRNGTLRSRLANERGEIRERELAHYISQLDRVRATTLAELQSRDDSWLDQEATFGNGRRINNYFKWFHVLSHEVNHRGQIRSLRRLATKNR